jgi:predicted phosphodiesterase
MIRLAVLSDIHGNLPALEAVLSDLCHAEVDHIIVAGDVVNWGPFSAEVMERLAAEKCVITRGNNELYLTDWQTPRAPQGWSHFTIPPYTIDQLGKHWMSVISTWPDSLSLRFREAPAIKVAHGTPRSHFEPLTPISTDVEISEMLSGVEETTIILAHTHLALDRQVGSWHILNSGSAGVPLDGNVGTATYMIVEGDDEGWRASLHRVPFDVERLLDAFKTTRFVEQTGIIGQLVVEEFRTARLEVAPFLNWLRACHPGAEPSYALFEQFTSVNKWDYMLPAYQINR